MFDELGDRMKGYEAVETSRRIDHTLPVCARIDGRGFSKFTKGLRRPFDERLSWAMIDTTKHLVEKTHARIGYTQSDEISLVWLLQSDNPEAKMFFDGKIQKLVSVLAGMATSAFMYVLSHADSEFAGYAARLPHFDARVFNVPSEEEAANAILWRTLDGRRNAISMTAYENFSPKALHKVSQAGMLEMIAAEGIDYAAYPAFFRSGTFVNRTNVTRPPNEVERLLWSTKRADPLPDTVTRTNTSTFNVDDFVKVTNRAAVVLHGAAPSLEPVQDLMPA